MKKIITVIVLFFFVSQIKAQLVINEYSCSNANTIADGFGQFEDWVELYNNSSSLINISGYYLSDDPANPLKWAIPATTDILAGQRRMVFCSDRGVVTGTGQIHPDFKLTQTHNEWFLISDASGVLIDSVKLNLTQRGHSRGRTSDGANTWSLFTTPSANASNAGSTPYSAYALKPIFSAAPGNYTTTQNIIITTTEPNATIRYTIDGTTPIATSPIYTSPISVAVTTVVRAKVFSSNALIAPSFTETNTYFINESTTMNIISVSGAFNAGPNGTPTVCSYEYFDKNKNFKIEFEGIATRHGHDSWAYGQKGFKVYADDKQGYAAEHQEKYFNTSTRDSFDMVILKAAGSDNYPARSNGGNVIVPNTCHLRDMFAHTLAEKYNLELDFRKYTPTIVFFNGQYWGVYEIRERVDKDYVKYNYGVKEKNFQNIRYWGGYVGGTSPVAISEWNGLANFITSNNMANPANYQIVKDSLNIKSFMQYFIFNEYLVNSDWMTYNSQWWRAKGNANTRVKWRYALWDMDAILGFDFVNWTGITSINSNNSPCDATTILLNNPNIKHTAMLNSLLQSPEFFAQWKQEWLDMMAGPLECTNIKNHFESVVALLTPEMNRHAIRWNQPAGTTSFNEWLVNVDSMRAYIDRRCVFVAQGLDTCYKLKPRILKLNVSPANAGNITLNGNLKSPYVWSKLMDADTIYNLKATPTAGQYWAFDHWEKQDPTNTFNPNSTTDLVQFNFKEKDSVIAFFKYFNYDSVEVTFNVTPAGTGTITLNGFVIPNYPASYILDRRFNYTINANAVPYYQFIDWSYNDGSTAISPSLTSKNATFTYLNKDIITAKFDSIPLPPPLPLLSDVTSRVYIPNAFTPNNDGHNDFFKIKVGKDIIAMDMSIFNRFGTKIFQSSDINKGWDGRFKDRDCEIGVYNYIIQVKYRNNKKEQFNGDVSLIR